MSSTLTIDIQNKSLDIQEIKNTSAGQPVSVQNDQGLFIKNAAGSNSVPLTATGASELTLTGSLIVNGGLTVTAITQMQNALDMGANTIVNVGNPVNPNDVVNKSYADSLKNGIQWKQPVRLATSAGLSNYTPAGSGIGKTLTSNSNVALVVNGINTNINDRILVKNETAGNAYNNGIYVVTAVGDGSHPWILTRSADANTSSLVLSGMAVFVDEGSTNTDVGFVLTTPDPIILDTTSLTFIQFASITSQAPTAGDGITISGTTQVSVRPDTTGGNQSIVVNSGAAPNGIAVNLASGGTIILTGSGLGVQIDQVTLANTGNILQVANGGIDDPQLANVYVKANSTVPLSADWNAGSYTITSQNLASATLTENQIVIVGEAGLLNDSANLTYDGTTFTAKAAVVLSTDTGVSFNDGNASPVEGMKIRIISANTTDATVTEMQVDGSSLTLVDNSAHTYFVYITAQCNGGTGGNAGLAATFKFELCATAAAGVATILPNPIKSIIANQRSGTWDANVTATSNKIQFNVTGDVNDNVTWAGWVQETTVSY